MFRNKMEVDVIRYVGGPHHISMLYKNNDNKKLYVFYCYTGKPVVTIEEEHGIYTHPKIVTCKEAKITIPIDTFRDGVWYSIEVDKEEDFDLVDKIVASILEDNK